MEFISVKEYMARTGFGETRTYKELQAGNIKHYRSSKRGKYLIPVGELVAAEKRMYQDWQR